jgi:8-oxo-dGTP diphosphatase
MFGHPESPSKPSIDVSAADSAGFPDRSDDSPVNLRCSVVVVRQDRVLLLHRGSLPASVDGDWVLPGGRPRFGESAVACARREVREETGLDVVVQRCLFIVEVAAPETGDREVELVFVALAPADAQPSVQETNRWPTFVPISRLRNLRLRPPLAGHLANLIVERLTGAAYLGNLWRPESVDDELG